MPCANYLMCVNGENISIYMPYINLLPSTMWTEMSYTAGKNNDDDGDNNYHDNKNAAR